MKQNCYVGIDIGDTSTVIGFVDEKGRIIDRETILMKHYPDFNKFINKIQQIYFEIKI